MEVSSQPLYALSASLILQLESNDEMLQKDLQGGPPRGHPERVLEEVQGAGWPLPWGNDLPVPNCTNQRTSLQPRPQVFQDGNSRL